MAHQESPLNPFLDIAFSRRGFLAGAAGAGAAVALSAGQANAMTPAGARASSALAATPAGAPFTVNANYLLKHDLVYQRPMSTEAEGFPLGNGSLGGLVWSHDGGIEFQIHKDNIWSDPDREGYGRAPRHAARVKIDLGAPIFSWIHSLDDCQQRLSLQRGEATFYANTNFGQSTIRSWLAQDRNVWVVEYEGPADAGALQAQLERIGSRTYGGWYANGFDRATTSAGGGSNTAVSVSGNTILLTETGSGMNFVVGMRVIGGTAPQRITRYRGTVTGPASKAQVLIAVITREEEADPAGAVMRMLDGAEATGITQLRSTKDAWFANFWARSSIHLGDDYLENHWYLRRYLMASGSRSGKPVIFNGGLWRWNRDVTNWVTPHHWNTQQQYYGLCATNDADLMRPYWKTYAEMAAKAPMRDLAVTRGATSEAIQLSEMHNFDGTMVDPQRGDMANSFTSAGQVAQRMWEVYEYTLDQAYLRDTAYPFMQRAANFYLDKLTWVASSNSYTLESTLYEDGNGFGLTTNCESDRGVILAIFPACLKAAAILGISNERVTKLQHVLDHLWEHRYWTYDAYPAGEVIAPSLKDNYKSHEWAAGCIPAWPSGVLGIDGAQTREGKAVTNFIKGTSYMYSHHPVAVAAARLGNGDEALRLLKSGVTSMQYFPNGLMYNCSGYPEAMYQLDGFFNMIGKFNLWWKDFYQAGMETTSLVSFTLTEMMVQSNEGKIRVFPAIPTEWADSQLAFDLMARGGFRVAALRSGGTVRSVALTSTIGGTCRLQNPWPGRAVKVVDGAGTTVAATETDGVLTFATTAGTSYVVTDAAAGAPTPVAYTGAANSAPKSTTWGKRLLGLTAGTKVT